MGIGMSRAGAPHSMEMELVELMQSYRTLPSYY